MRYAIARWAKQQRDMAYRIYITDALYTISENTMKFGGGRSMQKRYIEMIEPPQKEHRSGDEVAIDIIKRAGLIPKGGEKT